jgi:hypothetical protein
MLKWKVDTMEITAIGDADTETLAFSGENPATD